MYYYFHATQYARPFGSAQRAQDALKNFHKVPSGLESVLLLLLSFPCSTGTGAAAQLFAGFYNMQCALVCTALHSC